MSARAGTQQLTSISRSQKRAATCPDCGARLTRIGAAISPGWHDVRYRCPRCGARFSSCRRDESEARV